MLGADGDYGMAADALACGPFAHMTADHGCDAAPPAASAGVRSTRCSAASSVVAGDTIARAANAPPLKNPKPAVPVATADDAEAAAADQPMSIQVADGRVAKEATITRMDGAVAKETAVTAATSTATDEKAIDTSADQPAGGVQSMIARFELGVVASRLFPVRRSSEEGS
jgi:hypothetical protein